MAQQAQPLLARVRARVLVLVRVVVRLLLVLRVLVLVRLLVVLRLRLGAGACPPSSAPSRHGVWCRAVSARTL